MLWTNQNAQRKIGFSYSYSEACTNRLCTQILIAGGYTTSAINANTFNVSLSGASSCVGSGTTTTGCNLVCAGQVPVYGKPRVRRFRRDMLDLFLTDPDAAMRSFRAERNAHGS